MSENKTVVILGLFDSLHIGHRKVIETAVKAKKRGEKVVVYSFSYLPVKPFGDKMLYSTEIREKTMRNLGVDEVFFENPTAEFLAQSKEEFLSFLNAKYDISAYAIGEDYTFGKNGEGNADYLLSYAEKHGQKVFVVETEKENGVKISTTLIKDYLKIGEIEKANRLLKDDYRVEGVVKLGRKIGKTLLFPTVNVDFDGAFQIKNGVYYGYVILDKKYKAVINVGDRPTFNIKEKLIEAHILSFNGDLYGKKITIYFKQFLREIKKFGNISELKAQIEKDVALVKEIPL